MLQPQTIQKDSTLTGDDNKDSQGPKSRASSPTTCMPNLLFEQPPMPPPPLPPPSIVEKKMLRAMTSQVNVDLEPTEYVIVYVEPNPCSKDGFWYEMLPAIACSLYSSPMIQRVWRLYNRITCESRFVIKLMPTNRFAQVKEALKSKLTCVNWNKCIVFANARDASRHYLDALANGKDWFVCSHDPEPDCIFVGTKL